MGRGYTREYYVDLIEKIYSELPRASIAGDLIVGFPGETEKDFLQSVDLLENVRFQQAYIFKYSRREGTYAASHMDDTVPHEEKKRRNNQLLEIQEEIQLRRHRAFIGRKVDIIVEGPSAKDREQCFGRTDTNFRVIYPLAGEKPGDMVSVKIESVSPLTLFGKKSV
jgi:tRNA-2-methylthio-N6-dimethylallyladenosine synthase